MKQGKRLAFLLSLSVLACGNRPPRSAAGPQPATQSAQLAEDACAFVAPAVFSGRVSHWIGGCRRGQAHGRGALRAYVGERVVQIFFGTMEDGQPKLGVIDEFGSFVYGDFVNGKATDNGEYADMLRAFEEAIAAAREVSAAFHEAGNEASADFYAKRAANLEQQLH